MKGVLIMNVNSVASMSQISYKIFHTSQNNALFNHVLNQGSSTNSLFSSTNNTLNYKNLQDILSNRLNEHKQLLSDLDTYNKTSTSFYNDYLPAMKNLKNSSTALNNILSDSTASADTIIAKVKNFASDYKKTVDVLNANSNLSNKISNLAESFASPKYNSRAFTSIGISVNDKGTLTIDENKLMTALTNDLGKVNELLGGSNGLANKTALKADSSIANSTNLISFPKLLNSSVNSFMPGIFLDLYA